MIAAHRLHQLVRPFIGRVGIQALNDELVLAGGAAPAETQALLRIDIGADARHFRCGLPKFREHLAEWRAFFLGLQLDEHRAIVQRVTGIAADNGGDVHHGRILADLIGDLSLQVTHRRVGNILTRLCRDRKTANIFLGKKLEGRVSKR